MAEKLTFDGAWLANRAGEPRLLIRAPAGLAMDEAAAWEAAQKIVRLIGFPCWVFFLLPGGVEYCTGAIHAADIVLPKVLAKTKWQPVEASRSDDTEG